MDRLDSIRVLIEVARRQSFSAAADALNISAPSVSRIVGALEADMDVRLFNRTTRSVALTDAGKAFVARGETLLEEYAALRETTRDVHRDPRGRLRISSVQGFGSERIVPLIPAFQARYPQIEVEIELVNRKVDLIVEDYDLAIRVGAMDDTSLVARRIHEQRLVFVAAPDYVARMGAPTVPDDLTRHRVVTQISGGWGRVQRIEGPGGARDLHLPETFLLDSPSAQRHAILTGHVMGLLGDFMISDDIASGRLRRVLPGWATAAQPIYAVYVHRTYLAAKIRVFLDYLNEVLPKRTILNTSGRAADRG